MHVINKIRNNKNNISEIIQKENINEESFKTLDNKCISTKPPSNKLKNNNKNRFDKLYLDSKDKEKKYIHMTNQIEKEKLKECTFEPKTNMKRT